MGGGSGDLGAIEVEIGFLKKVVILACIVVWQCVWFSCLNLPEKYFQCLVLHVKPIFRKPNNHNHHRKPSHHRQLASTRVSEERNFLRRVEMV